MGEMNFPYIFSVLIKLIEKQNGVKIEYELELKDEYKEEKKKAKT